TNVTANEADNLWFIYRILERGEPGLFGLDWKPAPAFSLYVFLTFMQLFGTGVFGLRSASAILSALALFPFFFLARRQLSLTASLAATLLLATSVWYLNFSRSGWENVHTCLYALMAAWCLARGLDRVNGSDGATGRRGESGTAGCPLGERDSGTAGDDRRRTPVDRQRAGEGRERSGEDAGEWRGDAGGVRDGAESEVADERGASPLRARDSAGEGIATEPRASLVPAGQAGAQVPGAELRLGERSPSEPEVDEMGVLSGDAAGVLTLPHGTAGEPAPGERPPGKPRVTAGAEATSAPADSRGERAELTDWAGDTPALPASEAAASVPPPMEAVEGGAPTGEGQGRTVPVREGVASGAAVRSDDRVASAGAASGRGWLGGLWWFAASGVWTALGLYGYTSGRTIALALLAFLPFALVSCRGRSARVLAGFAVLGVVGAALFAPQVLAIGDRWEEFNRRVNDVNVLRQALPYEGETTTVGVLWHQFDRTARAFFLMDGSVVERGHYTPFREPLLEPLTGLLFVAGLALGVRYWRDTALWWCLLLVPLLMTQLFATGTPDAARALTALPFFYLFVGLAIDRLIRRPSLKRSAFRLAIALAVPVVALASIREYREWILSPAAASARQPAVELAEFAEWERAQREAARAGAFGFTVSDWRDRISRSRAEQTLRPAPGGTPVANYARFAGHFAGPGRGPGELTDPRGAAADRNGNLYVVDTGRFRVHKYGPDGRHLVTFGREGKGDGEFTEPTEVVIGPDGSRVYVLDSVPPSIQRFDAEGRFQARIALEGYYRPRGMSVGADGNLYVADTGRNRVVALTPEGQQVRVFGGDPNAALKLDQPTQVAMTGESLFVYEPDRGRILRFTPDFQPVSIVSAVKSQTVVGPHLVSGPGRTLLFTSPQPQQVTVYDADGAPIGTFGSQEGPGGNLALPVGIAVHERLVYVVDAQANRIARFELP
ncbi:MAG: glycosyltransferase family 39 protein, partial [Chloroflexi bacterium]|nr:glycosyltransferase family 39 protein [Chloroflexota bacterium]